jgi:hypothetical protein
MQRDTYLSSTSQSSHLYTSGRCIAKRPKQQQACGPALEMLWQKHSGRQHEPEPTEVKVKSGQSQSINTVNSFHREGAKAYHLDKAIPTGLTGDRHELAAVSVLTFYSGGCSYGA